MFDFLGMSVGVIINDASFVYDKDYTNEQHTDPRMQKLRPVTRKEAYAADVTYGTNNEFGFDYLRDNMVNDVELLRQRELNFAIVDEVDSILIDEARTPLIISAPAAENPESYYTFAKIAAKLTDEDYTLEEKRRQVALTDVGVEKVQKMLGIKNLYTPDYVRSIYHMDQALRAQTIFKRDKDYVVTNDGEVIIVDEHTGRLMQGRRYNEGLHQAIEAKEGVLTSQATINSDSRAAGIRDDMSIRAMDFKSLPQPFSLCPRLSRNLTPNAESMPVPASLVALPPIPTRNLRHPLFSASEIISPVPYVEVIHGFSSSGSRSGSPLAADISITAVFTPPDLTMP
jgi:hypothetical protein